MEKEKELKPEDSPPKETPISAEASPPPTHNTRFDAHCDPFFHHPKTVIDEWSLGNSDK